LGLRTVAAEDVAAPVVTVFYLPDGIYEKDFRAAMLSHWGIAIGNGEIGDDNVRVGTMGTAAQPQYVLATVAALEDTLRSFGYRFSPGAGVKAALEVLTAGDSPRWHGAQGLRQE
jgi:aspartate aminotransferase-like enzyme